jgi:hypothetical protein
MGGAMRYFMTVPAIIAGGEIVAVLAIFVDLILTH